MEADFYLMDRLGRGRLLPASDLAWHNSRAIPGNTNRIEGQRTDRHCPDFSRTQFWRGTPVAVAAVARRVPSGNRAFPVRGGIKAPTQRPGRGSGCPRPNRLSLQCAERSEEGDRV